MCIFSTQVDMASFSVSVRFLLSRPNASMPYKPGYEEDGFLKSLSPLKLTEIELLASNCTEVCTCTANCLRRDCGFSLQFALSLSLSLSFSMLCAACRATKSSRIAIKFHLRKDLSRRQASTQAESRQRERGPNENIIQSALSGACSEIKFCSFKSNKLIKSKLIKIIMPLRESATREPEIKVFYIS
jgi:hypothetical protein